MSTITVRKLAEATHAKLRERAARNGRSVEAEVRVILDDVVAQPAGNILTSVRHQFDGAHAGDVELPERSDRPRPVNLG